MQPLSSVSAAQIERSADITTHRGDHQPDLFFNFSSSNCKKPHFNISVYGDYMYIFKSWRSENENKPQHIVSSKPKDGISELPTLKAEISIQNAKSS